MENNQNGQGVSVQGGVASSSVERAFLKQEPSIRAVPTSELRLMNFDPSVALMIGYKGLEAVKRFRGQIAEMGKALDQAKIDQLEERLDAFSYCNGLCPPDPAPSDAGDLESTMTEAEALRGLMLSSARLVASAGVVDASHLDRVSNARGFANMAADLTLIGNFFVAHWDSIEGKTPITSADVERARELPKRIYKLRAISPESLSEREILRRQSFVRAVEAHEEARAGLGVVRRKEKDADELMPSMFGGRAPYGSKKQEPAEPEPPAAPVSPDPVAAAPVAVSTPSGPIGNMPASPFVK